jgi:hypothetical protein
MYTCRFQSCHFIRFPYSWHCEFAFFTSHNSGVTIWGDSLPEDVSIMCLLLSSWDSLLCWPHLCHSKFMLCLKIRFLSQWKGNQRRSFYTVLNLLKPSGYYMHMLEHYILPTTQCVCVLHMGLTINCDCFHKRHEPVGLCSGDVTCFLWGTDWVFILSYKKFGH